MTETAVRPLALPTPRATAAATTTTVAEGADWTALAACKGSDPDELFVTGAAQNKVKTRCFSCVVRTECLADALDNQVEFGVWGGMTERERRALLRRRPDVASWSALLNRARLDAQSGRGLGELGITGIMPGLPAVS